jgi:hypothetical protein
LNEPSTYETSREAASPCPVCGSYTGVTLATASPLLAVADVLVIRALEVAGKRIVRADRARFRQLGTKPWHVAHTLWRPDQAHVNKSLEHAWDVVPALLDSYGCCGVTAIQVVQCLDRYTADLLLTGTPHTLSELRYRFSTVLGIDLPDPRERHVVEMAQAAPRPGTW